ncbi:MAG: hypothetical protein AAGK92_10540 [Pseudomonadota bacterium]
MIAKTVPRLPVAMGLMLGVMGPLMLHGDGVSGPLALSFFVAAHLLVLVVGVLALRFIVPERLRHSLSAVAGLHRPRLRHLPYLFVGIVGGVLTVCLSCFILWSYVA